MGNSKKYSFLIKCTDGTVNLTTGYGDDYNEAREYVERSLNKEWSLITDVQVIKAFIAKENESRVVIKGTEWFWEALDQLEAQLEMKPLKEIGFLQIGMTLVDNKGDEGTITGIREIEGFGTWVEFNGDKLQEVMWDWERIRDDLQVKDGTYTTD
ncbi:hypothetical protein P9Z39_20820 [Bacillus thuringiensis]|uniref:hypothetical protein n=1 Tax=Bacillus thuringiensis TaxID=1428 RepID=UPI00211B34B6|nr:hypothetical protein [Bacillus thuringiensis]MEC2708098.1 hypothetical protein [Bacillus thuringiensis]